MDGNGQFETDIISTSMGDLSIIFLGHGSLLLNIRNKNIYVDVFGEVADYSKLPKADIVLLTHEHSDHMDQQALATIRTDDTSLVCTKACAQQVGGGIVLSNGDKKEINGIIIDAVPAYNVVHLRNDGHPFHPKGVGNGYVLTLGDTRIYIAGDTENIPEMKLLGNITLAFLPMNLPYTMTPEMVADAALSIQPCILYPYHYGKTDPQILLGLLKNNPGIEVRIRRMA